MYVLPNRKAFSDAVTRIFLKYRGKDVDPLTLDPEADLCEQRGGPANNRELFTYQKLARDYLLMETPYRGLLLYHGLGSGKTCSSIAVAESLMSTKNVFILLPASLQENYRGEIRKCGDPIYALEQHWKSAGALNEEKITLAKNLGISEAFLSSHKTYYTTTPGGEPNFKGLGPTIQKIIRAQIDDVLNSRFKFINYNGIMSTNVDKILPPDQPDMFNDSVVIIDEAHNLIGNVVKERALKMKLYDMIYRAKSCKVVLLSGTPVVNRPVELAYLMNLLRGPIMRIVVPVGKSPSWDESKMTDFLKKIPEVDMIEFNATKREIMLTRNPPNFQTQYNSKNERIAVKYVKDSETESDFKKWVGTWKDDFAKKMEVELSPEEGYRIQELECLPTDSEEFAEMFLDGLKIKNPLLLGRRIQGLVSYFKGADERLLPKRLDEDQTLVKVEMSSAQFLRYLEERNIELQREKAKSRMKSQLDDDFGSFRMTSRLICNYAVPIEMRNPAEDEDEDHVVDKPEILKRLIAEPDKFLRGEGLMSASPKFFQILNDLLKNYKTDDKFNNQFIYSQFLTLEGIGVFTAILDANGFQPYKLINDSGIWREDPEMSDKPAYAIYSGKTSEDERELYRQIFNQDYSDTFPQILKDSIKTHRLCVFMASSAGAEGITLADVRNVYIMEPYWNPSRIDQVIGRAIRICSHRKLPMDQRTVKVQMYVSVFSPDQIKNNDAPNIVAIRRNDTSPILYDGGDEKPKFVSSDEYLYEVAYRKNRVIKNIALIIKQSAVDCEIHRKLHSRETPMIQCMRFDTNVNYEDMAYDAIVKKDTRDVLYTKNVIGKTHQLQKVNISGNIFIYEPSTKLIFDYIAFEDTRRLLPIGVREDKQIRFFGTVPE